VWNGCAAALPHLKEQGSGAIVNTASLAGVIGSPNLSGYSLTKGAVVNLTRAVAAEAGPDGVRVNAVCPGVTETPMPKRDRSEEEWEELASRMAEQYPLRRLGRPEDVANAMLYLASDEADWVTGQALVVDGGFSCA
jgi:NAD(P)-dependent dehydrogenase (short-subunit alcohol dehydrogenase family)